MVWFLKPRRRRSRESVAGPREVQSDEASNADELFDHSCIDKLFDANRTWANAVREDDPTFFDRLRNQQQPEFLWIGCSDSRVPANQILGLAPGEIFVQRNVGNLALHTDMNLMACLEYAVKSLKVKTVLLCGHYHCGAVKAALQLPSCTPGLVNCWISDIREARNQAAPELAALGSEERVSRLCELNVLRQVFHVCTSPVVQAAWADGQELHVWGVIYDPGEGLMRRLAGPFSAGSEVDGTLEGFERNDSRVVRDPLTKQLRLELHASAGCDGASVAASVGSSRGTSPRNSEAQLRAQLNNFNLLSSVIEHTSWSIDKEQEQAALFAAAKPV